MDEPIKYIIMKNLTAVLFLTLTVSAFSQEPTIITSDEHYLGVFSSVSEEVEVFILKEDQGFSEEYSVLLEKGCLKDKNKILTINNLSMPYLSVKEESVSSEGGYITEVRSYIPTDKSIDKIIETSYFWTDKLEYKITTSIVIMKNNNVFAFVN